MTPDLLRPDVAVVVPVRNGAAHLGELIDHLLAQRIDARWELVVVDNGSDDGSGDVARARLERGVNPALVRSTVLRYDEVLGYASPRNAGVRASSAPKLAFCDADDLVAPDWLRQLSRALDDCPLVASVVEVMKEGSVPPTEPPSAFGLPVVHCCGMGCTRSLFERLGGFDPEFDRGGEDVDFSLRARAIAGVIPVLASGASYWLRLREAPFASFRQSYRNGRSQVLLFERHRHSLNLKPRPFSILRARFTDLVRWSPRVFRTDERSGYLAALGLFAGRTAWAIRRRQRWF